VKLSNEDRLRTLRIDMGLYGATHKGLYLMSLKMTYQEYKKEYE
jgi:hypothetical protein